VQGLASLPCASPVFKDRDHAGRLLAERLKDQLSSGTIIVAIPRGGVPLAVPIARLGAAPLSTCLVAKVRHPEHHENGIGAIASDGSVVLNHPLIRFLGLRADTVSAAVHTSRTTMNARSMAALRGVPRMKLAGRQVILVDDGIATGYTALAAVRTMRRVGVSRVIVATPVCTWAAATLLRRVSIPLVSLVEPTTQEIYVPSFYESFTGVSDGDVLRALDDQERFLANVVTTEETTAASCQWVIDGQ